MHKHEAGEALRHGDAGQHARQKLVPVSEIFISLERERGTERHTEGSVTCEKCFEHF